MTSYTSEQLYLAAIGEQQDRISFSEEDLQAVVSEEIERMYSSIQRIRLVYFLWGMKATDPFYQMMRKNMYTSQRSRLCPRIRLDRRYKTPSFAWERIRQRIASTKTNAKTKSEPGKGRSYIAYVGRKGSGKKEKAKVVLMSEHVTINKKTHTVDPHVFDAEPEWARVAGLLIEQKLKRLRCLNRTLASVSRALCSYAKQVRQETEGQ